MASQTTEIMQPADARMPPNLIERLSNLACDAPFVRYMKNDVTLFTDLQHELQLIQDPNSNHVLNQQLWSERIPQASAEYDEVHNTFVKNMKDLGWEFNPKGIRLKGNVKSLASAAHEFIKKDKAVYPEKYSALSQARSKLWRIYANDLSKMREGGVLRVEEYMPEVPDKTVDLDPRVSIKSGQSSIISSYHDSYYKFEGGSEIYTKQVQEVLDVTEANVGNGPLKTDSQNLLSKLNGICGPRKASVRQLRVSGGGGHASVCEKTIQNAKEYTARRLEVDYEQGRSSHKKTRMRAGGLFQVGGGGLSKDAKLVASEGLNVKRLSKALILDAL